MTHTVRVAYATMSGGKIRDVYTLARMLHIRHEVLLVIPSLTCSAN